MSLDFNTIDAAAYVPPQFSSENIEPINLCSLMNDGVRVSSKVKMVVCDPYFDLQIPVNHPLRGYVYGEGSALATPEALRGVTQIGGDRVRIQAMLAAEGEKKRKLSVDIARLPGRAYFVRDNVAGIATLYFADGTKIVLCGDGTATISGESGQRKIKEGFLMNVGDSMLKISPRAGAVHLFSNDGGISTITHEEYWVSPRRQDDRVFPMFKQAKYA